MAVHPALTRYIFVRIEVDQPFKIRYGGNKGSGAAVLAITCSLGSWASLALKAIGMNHRLLCKKLPPF